jgi:hypothetical protein
MDIMPSNESIAVLQERLKGMGFLLSDKAAQEVLRDVLAIESSRLGAPSSGAEAEQALMALRRIHEEALTLLLQGAGVLPTRQLGAPPAAPRVARPAAAPEPAPAPAPEDEHTDLTELVRQRLGAEVEPGRPAHGDIDDAPREPGGRRGLFGGVRRGQPDDDEGPRPAIRRRRR